MVQMRDQNVWNVEWSGVGNVVELQVVCLVMELEAALEIL